MAVVLVPLVVFIVVLVYLFRKKEARIRELAGWLADQTAELDDSRAKAAQQSARLKDLTEELEKKDAKLNIAFASFSRGTSCREGMEKVSAASKSSEGDPGSTHGSSHACPVSGQLQCETGN
nr:uncharacterized protein LOC113845401 isoform X12 [Anas platyrhynchos]